MFCVTLTNRNHADALSLELELGICNHLGQYGSLGQLIREPRRPVRLLSASNAARAATSAVATPRASGKWSTNRARPSQWSECPCVMYTPVIRFSKPLAHFAKESAWSLVIRASTRIASSSPAIRVLLIGAQVGSSPGPCGALPTYGRIGATKTSTESGRLIIALYPILHRPEALQSPRELPRLVRHSGARSPINPSLRRPLR